MARITNTFPVFLPALLVEFGGSRAATASTASLLWVGGALLSPVTGYLVPRWNPRLLVSLGLGMVALGMLLGSLAPTLPLFLAAMGQLRGPRNGPRTPPRPRTTGGALCQALVGCGAGGRGGGGDPFPLQGRGTSNNPDWELPVA